MSDPQDEQPEQDDQPAEQEAPEGGAEAAGAAPALTEEERREVEEERERRLDPDNRPDGAIVDNTDADLPTVKEFEELNADDEEAAGRADPSEAFEDIEVSDEERREIEEERERRLDPDNRPDGAIVDNSGMTVDDDGRLVEMDGGGD